jgi:hypothetical protein
VLANGEGGPPQTVPDVTGKKGAVMKLSLNSKLITLALALMLATSAFAASDTHKGNLQVFDPVQVNGKQLSAGEYQLKWEGNGPDVQLSISQGKNLVATVPAHVVELPKSAPDSAAVVNNHEDGTKSLAQVRFSGKKYALSIGTESASAENAGSSK